MLCAPVTGKSTYCMSRASTPTNCIDPFVPNCFLSGGLQDKKFEVDKRGMNLGDFNDIMRKGRSGFRPPNSKDMGTPDGGPYFEKVRHINLVRIYCRSCCFF